MASKEAGNANSHPDSQIYPTATGTAKPTVDAHAAEHPLKLYAGWFCPFVQRVWMVLEEKQIPYQYIEVNPYHKPESLLKLNPRGLVPTLEYEGKPLYESTVLVELLEDAFPEHPLRPSDPYDRARMRIWTDFVTTRMIPSFMRFLQFQPATKGEGQSDPGLEEKRQEFTGYVKDFTREMDEEGPFFAGSKPMLADFALAPFALRFWVLDHFKGGSGVPKAGQWGPDDKVWGRWHRWFDALNELPSTAATTSDKEHYLPLYQRYADDLAQSEMAKSIRAGGGTV